MHVGKNPIRVLQKTTVSTEGAFLGDYADIWAENAKYSYYHMDTAVEGTENNITIDDEGDYRARFALNDQLYTEIIFLSVSQKDVYFGRLKDLIIYFPIFVLFFLSDFLRYSSPIVLYSLYHHLITHRISSKHCSELVLQKSMFSDQR